jgi:hypothetical protein
METFSVKFGRRPHHLLSRRVEDVVPLGSQIVREFDDEGAT